MQELAVSVLSSVLVSGLLVGALIFLSKTWIGERIKREIESEYAAKLEIHKAQLKAAYDIAVETHKAMLKGQYDKELESIRADLTIAVHEHQVRFTALHEKVGEVVAGTYARLHKYLGAVGDCVKVIEDPSDPLNSERRKVVDQTRREFADFFFPQAIYLPKNVSAQVSQLDRELTVIANRLLILEDHRDNIKTHIPEWADAVIDLGKRAAPFLDALHDEFQALLGASPVTSVPEESHGTAKTPPCMDR